jgi:cellulose synthase operon protein C
MAKISRPAARSIRRLANALCLSFVTGSAVSCGASTPSGQPATAADFRDEARDSDDPEQSSRWLLGELLAPGGKSDGVKQARKRLEELGGKGGLAHLARGLDDEFHGRLLKASDHYLAAAKELRSSASQDADLLAQFAVHKARSLRSNTQGLWDRWQPWVHEAIKSPGHLGWRTRDELVQWWLEEAWTSATSDVESLAVKNLGCMSKVRIAGPFGIGARSDALLSFPPEDLGVWPERFPADEHVGRVPKVLEVSSTGCTVEVEEASADGVHYAEAEFEVKEHTRAVLVVANALKVWVDGALVLDRDLLEWGSWTKIAAGIDVPKGRHRIVARLVKNQTSVRLLEPSGIPLSLVELDPGSALTGIDPARSAFEPSPLRRYVTPRGTKSVNLPWVRLAAAELSHEEGEDEVAALLLEPLVKDRKTATGPALATAAGIVQGDPLFDINKTEDMMRALHEAAVERDPELWKSELSVVGQSAKSRGVIEVLPAFERLTERYREVPPLLGSLASVYGELGWRAEYVRTVKLRAERFPEDTEGLYAAAQVLSEQGERKKADALHERIRQLDPDSENLVGLSLERREYDKALAELERLRARRPQRDDLESRMEEVRVTAGRTSHLLPLLEARVERDPMDSDARLELADARFAQGDADALRDGVVDAVLAGASPEPIKQAVDLIEGTTELESFRVDGRAVIRDYEKAALHLPGTAARVLDYMAAWVRADGSSRLLEHEIVRIQSEEAIGRFAEHAVKGDVILQMRVIKQDGRVLEPEPVSGKPTVTFPHLEVGDYIETEQIYAQPGSPGGAYFDGPHWFFQEQGVAYARSEFVLIAPAHRNVVIESTGSVPEPVVEERGYFRVHRWRVDLSPPAVTEPMSVPLTEYLPSVRIGWGLDLDRRLRLLTSQVTETAPVDPRIVEIAKKIVSPVPPSQPEQRAKRLYHWVLDNVQDGEEDDGRRVVTGKRGSQWRAFETLCRALDIPVTWAVVKNRLAPPPRGPDMEARQYNQTVLRVGNPKSPVWLTFDGKFVPFGYVPAAVRGMPGFVLDAQGPVAFTLPETGEEDGIAFDIDARLGPDGSAEIRITQRYSGHFASSLRQALDEIAEARLHDILEEKLLASAFPGARLLEFEFLKRDDPDAPLSIVMVAEMANLARSDGRRLVLSPPYATQLSQFAALPTRETALLIAAERHQSVDMTVTLPAGARVNVQPPRSLEFGDFSVEVNDALAGAKLKLRRKVTIPPTRVTPEDYPRFQKFTREADEVITSDVVIDL